MMSFWESLTSTGTGLTITNVVVDEDKKVNKKALSTTITGATSTSVFSKRDPISAAEQVNNAKAYVESLSDEELSMYLDKLENKENSININAEETQALKNNHKKVR